MATRTRRRSLMRALKLSARQLQEWEDAMPGLSLRTDQGAKTIVGQLTACGLSAKRVAEYREAGFHALHGEDVIRLYEAGVPATYVHGQARSPQAEVLEDLILLHHSGVPRSDAFGHGYGAHLFLDLHQKGVPTAYIAQLARAGCGPELVLSSWEAGLSVEYAAMLGKEAA